MRLQEVSSAPKEPTLDPISGLIDSIQQEANEHKGYGALKRSFDFTAALCLVLLCLPLLVIVALCIKISSKGPILFVQERVGQGGKLFKFYKFRSMKVDNDTSIHEAYMQKLIRGEVEANKAAEAPQFKIENDPRVTDFGRFIRKTSLDELPQLFNVLNGSMSLVGPRPPIPYEVKAYKSWHLQRLSVKPGVTGLWQVSGRSSIAFDEMVQLDLEYIEKRNLFLDLKILFQTIPAALNTSTAA
ncbi:MAG: sugar transferase [Rhodothermales bacterium]